MGDDRVVLTDRERRALAGLAESIGDPWLAGQLAGQEPQSARPARRSVGSFLSRFNTANAPGWIGVVLVLAGAALALTTFASSIPAASLGLLVMGIGLWRLLAERGGAMYRRLSRLTERRVPEPVSSPPRTPPAAP